MEKHKIDKNPHFLTHANPHMYKLTWSFPSLHEISFGHFVIIIAIYDGQKEAVEITMKNIENFKFFPEVFLSAIKS